MAANRFCKKLIAWFLRKTASALYRVSHKAEDVADKLNMLCYWKYEDRPVPSEAATKTARDALKILEANLRFSQELDRSFQSGLEEIVEATIKIKRPASYIGETKVG
jgi:hypothetical protein